MCKGPERSIDAYGITCTSRYGHQGELNVMKGVAKLLVSDGEPVIGLYRDSKSGCLTVELSVVDADIAEWVAHRTGDLLDCFVGGHSGIVINVGDIRIGCLGAGQSDWKLDELKPWRWR